MGDAALCLWLMTRTARKPNPDADRPHVRHPLGKKPEAIGKHVADDEWLCHDCVGVEVSVDQRLASCRKSLTDRELEEHMYDNTRVNCAARKLGRLSTGC